MYQQYREGTTTAQLSDGHTIPLVGLGTWQTENAEEVVKVAIDIGYRHIDCATVYGNQEEVGKALQAKIEDGTVKREELFITGKLWGTHHNPERARAAIEKSLSDLNITYLDLYLLHWPVSLKDGDDLFPTDADGNYIFSDTSDYLSAYKSMEGMVDDGLTRSIGLSNFNRNQTKNIIDNCRVKPVVNQVECHPYFNQQRLVDFCREHGILVTAYSPFSSPGRPWAKPEEPKLTDDPKVIQIAKTHNKSVNQVLVRYLIQRGIPALPKSSKEERLKANLQVTGFKLSFAEMATLNGMDCFRAIVFPPWESNKDYPFKEDF